MKSGRNYSYHTKGAKLENHKRRTWYRNAKGKRLKRGHSESWLEQHGEAIADWNKKTKQGSLTTERGVEKKEKEKNLPRLGVRATSSTTKGMEGRIAIPEPTRT